MKGSYLSWMIDRLGPFYSSVIPLTGLSLFFAACFVVMRSRRPGTIAAWLVFVPLPLLIGLYAAISRWVSFSAGLSIAAPGTVITSVESAEVVSRGLVPIYFGLIEIFPAFLILAVGLLVRTYQAGGIRPGATQNPSNEDITRR
jgi:hypothetical protein